MNIQENILLKELTTFQIGGPARFFVEVKTDTELQQAVMHARDNDLKLFIWGGGSNILASDEGFDGLIIYIKSDNRSLAYTELAADAGCNLRELINETAQQGIGGWEKLAGIPGTIGGAVRGNAGAFGAEIRDFVQKVRAHNIDTGETREFLKSECAFAYRQSFFKNNPEWIITRVFLNLEKIDTAQAQKVIADTIAERERRHIQDVKAAGSYFMNPSAPEHVAREFETEKKTKTHGGRVPAGWLIEKAGLKGAQIGEAVASEQHPNYLTNSGNASAKDVRELAQKIKLAVHEKFGITLHEEAVVL